ncbi:DUF2336 domain-containing protein [Methylobacterium persicinum]|uniref:Uncharacterized protein (DUF2336 family) n=1 Tax=Methylobacterium persicinum TaxID=374426 RepID=A0ABU0HSR1_9HYPH|nr:DUF2336 domain-containing protein [Methylobacterium persicinum]MDQ0445368.1 uncharacterized protein (DUF2336 family) [Methylobacterium persicinum]GJE40255.1 hypothetical protein KHHGKMAE_4346 [Methylobacterium persicinum]
MSASLGRMKLPRLDLLVRDIEAAILGKDHARQSELVLRSAAALTRHWSRLPAADKPSFDRLLASLLDQVDLEARATFAKCLTPLRRAPRITATRLACDPSPAVSISLLEHCASFDDDWLLQLIESVGLEQQTAIARRSTLGPEVSGALLQGRNPTVARALLTNPGAAVATETLDSLVTDAAGSLPLMLALANRADLSQAGRATLAAIARRSASQALIEEGEFSGGEANTLLDQVAQSFGTTVCADCLGRYAASAAVAARNPRAKPTSSSTIADWLEHRRHEDVLATLARDVDLPVAVLIACYEAPTPHALTIIMRGLGHPWSLLKALLQARASGMVSPECLGVAHRLNFEIGPRTARMVTRYASIQSGMGAFIAAAASDDWHHVTLVARASARMA